MDQQPSVPENPRSIPAESDWIVSSERIGFVCFLLLLFRAERFAGIDLILSCGDLPPEYLSFLVTMLNVPVYYVRGNHDVRLDGYRPEGCFDLDAKLVRFRGVRIMGFEGSLWYSGKPHQYTERQMRNKILKVRPKM